MTWEISKETDSTTLERIIASLSHHFPQTIATLTELIKIPSIAWPEYDQENLTRSAKKISDELRELAFFDDITIERSLCDDQKTMGQPAVIARREAHEGHPTVLLYAHHDVQPVGKVSDWDSNPFLPVVRDGRLYGRGSADDKAGVVVHIESLRAFIEACDGETGLGVVVFVEGEEEYGSPSFTNFLRDNKKMLNADVIVIADSGNWSVTEPSLTTSLRGNITLTITVRTLEHASHSGMYGGAVPDAFMAFSVLAASFYDTDGSLAIAGLRTNNPKKVPDYDEALFRKEVGVLDNVTEIGSGSRLEKLWFQPALTIIGIDAPHVADASNTLLPEVSAKISVRIAPDQDPAVALAAIEEHVHSHSPFGSRATITDVECGSGFLADDSGTFFQTALTAFHTAWGNPVINMGIGGSIPFISEFKTTFPDAEVLVTGVEDPDSRAHSPNESLHLGVFQKALISQTVLLERLSRSRKSSSTSSTSSTTSTT